MPLHVVPPAPLPPETKATQVRKRVKAMPRPASTISCHRCGSMEVQLVYIGAQYQGGKVKGGTKQWLCAMCNRMGERVVLA